MACNSDYKLDPLLEQSGTATTLSEFISIDSGSLQFWVQN